MLGPAFGTYVDRHRKHAAMMLATAIVGRACFAVATVVFVAVDSRRPAAACAARGSGCSSALTLLGSVAGQMRGIALSTCVTLLVPEDRRDRANGMVGTVTGVSFAITSVFSGLVIGRLGMGWALVRRRSRSPSSRSSTCGRSASTSPSPSPADGEARAATSTSAARSTRSAPCPGSMLLILLAAFNNLLGGVFMALMDAYGLSLVSVETWGFLWGFISLAFIAGGLVVARFGLGPQPAAGRSSLGNLVNWIGVLGVRAAVVDRAADHRHGRVARA